jgi:AcrR family transcriptional regulator
MPPAASAGRRERSKREKLERITAAARDLFAEHGVDEVTTQQIADRADVATGTLFLYAKNKGELLLLVQNSTYQDALQRGQSAAESIPDIRDAVIAIVEQIVECNRVQVENGRTYLREMIFGDPHEPHHAEALLLTRRTEEALATVIARDGHIEPSSATRRARVISSIMLLTMASPLNVHATVEDLVEQVRSQLETVLEH